MSIGFCHKYESQRFPQDLFSASLRVWERLSKGRLFLGNEGTLRVLQRDSN